MDLVHIITEQRGHSGAEFAVWAYDRDQPRMPDNPDPRLRYKPVRFVGVFPTRRGAEAAISPEDALS